MSEKEDKIVKNFILNQALHEYKLKLKNQLKKDNNNEKAKKILNHIEELEDMD